MKAIALLPLTALLLTPAARAAPRTDPTRANASQKTRCTARVNSTCGLRVSSEGKASSSAGRFGI